MRHFLHHVRISFRRLSFRWVLICMAVILPINALAIAYSVTLYQNYREKLRTDQQVQLRNIAADFSAELNRVSEALVSGFSSDAFRQYLIDPNKDASLVAVACKSMISGIQDDRGTGMSFIWDHVHDTVSIFHNNRRYGLETQRAFEAWVRSISEASPFSHARREAVVDGHVFLGDVHTFRDYSIGIFTDAGLFLERCADHMIDPKGTLGLMDSSGNPIAALRDERWVYGAEAAPADSEELMGQPVDDAGCLLYQTLDNSSPFKTLMKLPAAFWLLVSFTLLSLAAIPLIYLMSNRILIRPVARMLEGMQALGEGHLDYRLPAHAGTIDMEVMNKGFNTMAEEIQTLRIKTYEQEIEKLKTDAINLKLQVNPHMFLNSLNTIYSLGRVGKNQEVCDFAVLLMQYFRYAFRSDAEFGSVKEEMGFVSSYMKIQAIRYPERFSFTFVMEPEEERVMIPRFIIENFVENVVKYALQSEKETEIIVQARVQEDRLYVSITDDGCGIEEDTLRQIQSGQIIEDSAGRHTGIWNTRRRLDFYYPGQYELSITSAIGAGTQVYLSLPAEPPERNEIMEGASVHHESETALRV